MVTGWLGKFRGQSVGLILGMAHGHKILMSDESLPQSGSFLANSKAAKSRPAGLYPLGPVHTVTPRPSVCSSPPKARTENSSSYPVC